MVSSSPHQGVSKEFFPYNLEDHDIYCNRGIGSAAEALKSAKELSEFRSLSLSM